MQPEGIMQQNRESHTREKKHNYWKVIIVQHVRKNSATEGKIMHPKREKHATEMKKNHATEEEYSCTRRAITMQPER